MISAGFAAQTTGPAAREGLPYWIFFLLISLIFLLLVFIFLRDKDLRRRISLALAGTKRRMHRTRLTLRLKREKRRKSDLHLEIGRRVWEARLAPDRFGPDFTRLERIETEATERHSALKETLGEIMALRARFEDARRVRKSGSIPSGSGTPKDALPSSVLKEEEKSLKTRIRTLDRRIESEKAALRRLDGDKDGIFRRLGDRTDESRIGHAGLPALYERVDLVNRNILSLMEELDELK